MSEDEIILTTILQCRLIDLSINKPVLTSNQQKQFEDYKRRRLSGEPLQYILGTCNFMGLELEVNPSVLVPRPETEQLVDGALKVLTADHSSNSANPVKILDLGTGSGNIAIALAHFFSNSKIVTVDVSVKALEIARANAKKHGVDDRIEFIQEDMRIFLAKNKEIGRFDMVISNPPYIPTRQLDSLPKDVKQEPLIALDGGADGLDFYKFIIKYSPCLLRQGACLMMEFGDGQAQPIKALLEADGHYNTIQILNDLAGRERIINGKVHH